MIVDRDQAIVKQWFEKYFFGTITQIEKSFFRDQQYSYEIARKRLGAMRAAGLIKTFRDSATNRNVNVIVDKTKRMTSPGWHRLITLDVLAEMNYCGFSIETFEIEKQWMNGKVKSDAFTIFTLGNRRYHFFIETQIAKHSHDLWKYDSLRDSGEVQNYLGKQLFPRILFISDTNYSDTSIKSAQVVQLDTRLNKFPLILL